jgi:hypothetical protein
MFDMLSYSYVIENMKVLKHIVDKHQTSRIDVHFQIDVIRSDKIRHLSYLDKNSHVCLYNSRSYPMLTCKNNRQALVLYFSCLGSCS